MSSPTSQLGQSRYLGEGAEELPGQEALAGIDPRQIFMDRPNIYVIPGRTDCVARFFPRDGLPDTPANRQCLDELNATQIEHWQALEAAAGGHLRVAPFHSFRTRMPDSLRYQPFFERDELALASIIRVVQGSKRESLSVPAGLGQLYATAGYLVWVIQNGKSQVLLDIGARPGQTRGNYWTDTEPFFVPFTQAFLRDRLSGMRYWYQQLPPGSELYDRTGERLDYLERQAT